jgi:hypothetical protein
MIDTTVLSKKAATSDPAAKNLVRFYIALCAAMMLELCPRIE